MDEIDKLNHELESLDITAYQVSQYTGIAQSTIGRILSGQTKKPNASTIASIWNYINQIKSGDVKTKKPIIMENDDEISRLRQEVEIKNQHIQLLNEKLKKCEEDLFFNRKPDKRDA